MLQPTTHTFIHRVWRILPDAKNTSLVVELRDADDRVQFALVDLGDDFRILHQTDTTFDAWVGIQANLKDQLLVGQWQDPQFPGITDYFLFDWVSQQRKNLSADKAQQTLFKQQLHVHLPHARNTDRAEPTTAYQLAQQQFEQPLAPHYDEFSRHGYTFVSVYPRHAEDPSGETPGLLSQELLVYKDEELKLLHQLQTETRKYALDPFSIMGGVLVYLGAPDTLCLVRLPEAFESE